MLSRRRFFAGLAAAVAVVPVLGPSTLLRKVMIPGVDLRQWMRIFDKGNFLLAEMPFQLGSPVTGQAIATGTATRFDVLDRTREVIGGGTIDWREGATMKINTTAILDGSSLQFWGFGNA